MDQETVSTLLLTGGCCLIMGIFGAAFALISLVAGVTPLALIGGLLHRRSRQAKEARAASQSWPATGGTVLKSRVEVSGGEVTSVSPRVVYEYAVGGSRYENDQVRAGDDFLRVGSDEEAYETIDRYPVGATVTVYYNPDNPAESALER